MQKGQVIDTRGRSVVAKRKLLAVDNDDDHEERDMRFHDINEEQDDVESDDIEDIDMLFASFLLLNHIFSIFNVYMYFVNHFHFL
ncbi:hypothetical protein Hdeb2414_s0014g00434981 [Helianthus debilis subsp. tardiflorus]